MATKKEILEQSQQAMGDFIKLADYLFGDKAPLDVNEIPQDNPFYQDIRALSDEMELDWENMEHGDSNRVMLNILSEYFTRIQPEDDEECKLTVTVSVSKKD